MKIEFDFQQGMRSLGRMTRRAYDTVKDKAEEAAQDGSEDAAENGDGKAGGHAADGERAQRARQAKEEPD
jgi:hypothetical protein